jgi:hypothetical protein
VQIMHSLEAPWDNSAVPRPRSRTLLVIAADVHGELSENSRRIQTGSLFGHRQAREGSCRSASKKISDFRVASWGM